MKYVKLGILGYPDISPKIVAYNELPQLLKEAHNMVIEQYKKYGREIFSSSVELSLDTLGGIDVNIGYKTNNGPRVSTVHVYVHNKEERDYIDYLLDS